jgi:hypothetical protein
MKIFLKFTFFFIFILTVQKGSAQSEELLLVPLDFYINDTLVYSEGEKRITEISYSYSNGTIDLQMHDSLGFIVASVELSQLYISEDVAETDDFYGYKSIGFTSKTYNPESNETYLGNGFFTFTYTANETLFSFENFFLTLKYSLTIEGFIYQYDPFLILGDK